MEMYSENENIINVEHLNKVFYSVRGFWKREKHPVQAVKDISFCIRKGELFGMVGPNGAGKTTTVKMLATLLLPTGGKATVFGHDVVKDTDKIRPRIGFTFGGNKGLYSRLSALDNLKYFAELYKLDPETIETRVREMLEAVGLTGREKDRVETYSSGMQQRLHLARAMLHDPDLIFLDEPTVGIDPIGSREIRALVKELVGRGKTILLTTHYMYEAEELCDRIAVVNHGEIVALDTPASLKMRASGDSVIVVHTPTENPALESELSNLQSEINHLSNSHEMVSIHTQNPGLILNALAALLEQQVISNIEVRNATLEDVYVQIIKESAS
ncbi:MAG TPA: ABC transporter ATP-binding protein [Anaerolineales bacterium]|nr:ABC transporter ATP-binding protein [Anaerolineales bacterium]